MNFAGFFTVSHFRNGHLWSPLATPTNFFTRNWFHNNKNIRRILRSIGIIISSELKCMFLYDVIFYLFGFTVISMWGTIIYIVEGLHSGYSSALVWHDHTWKFKTFDSKCEQWWIILSLSDVRAVLPDVQMYPYIYRLFGCVQIFSKIRIFWAKNEFLLKYVFSH